MTNFCSVLITTIFNVQLSQYVPQSDDSIASATGRHIVTF